MSSKAQIIQDRDRYKDLLEDSIDRMMDLRKQLKAVVTIAGEVTDRMQDGEVIDSGLMSHFIRAVNTAEEILEIEETE